jgi:HAMP domain-containing protein
MYRDSANALDEHDRAVGAILIGEALVDECERARAVVLSAETERQQRWRTITDVHDTYPEVWRHLDQARTLLASRGANTTSYDELRPRARRAPTNADGTDIEQAALDDARRAIADLKLAVPGADWNAIRDRTDGLVDTRISRPRGQRLVTFTVLALFATALCGWLIAIVPERRLDRREAMRQALSEVVAQRKLRIEQVRFELGARCDVERARELAKLLAQDGRTSHARAFGTSYIDRCGDDEVVDNWAHAPAPVARPIDWTRFAAPDPVVVAPPMAASLARP